MTERGEYSDDDGGENPKEKQIEELKLRIDELISCNSNLEARIQQLTEVKSSLFRMHIKRRM